MAYYATAVTGSYDIRLPQWGRCFWQAPSDGRLFLAFASGTTAAYYVSSADSGVNWSAPQYMFDVEEFNVHNNFDVFMDPRDHVHTTFRFNGSGCYKFFGRISGGDWTSASGAGVVPYMLAGDTGNAKGVQASLTVSEASGTLGDTSATYPLLRIAAKDTGNIVSIYNMGSPFNSGSLLQETITGATSPGINGGYPFPFNDAGTSSNAFGVSWFNESGIIDHFAKTNAGGGWIAGFLYPKTLASGEIPWGPNINMAIGSGSLRKNSGWILVTSASGHEMWGNSIRGNSNSYKKLEATEESGVWPWESKVALTGIYSVGDSGTNCDFTHDDSGNVHLFFQNRDSTGSRYVVSRFISNQWIDTGGGTVDDTLTFRDAWPSGRADLFTANLDNTGGRNNILYWDKFKAVKHPKPPGTGNLKGIYLVTQGYVPVYPSGGILRVWNASESPAHLTPFQQPHFKIDYTATSGTSNPIFSGVLSTVGTWTDIPNIFDKSVTTYGQCASGSSITLALNGTRHIDRVEIVGESFSTTNARRDIGQIDMYASYDNVNYAYMGTVPSGNAITGFTRIRRFTTDTADSTIGATNYFTKLVDPFAARYIKLNWHTAYAIQRRISEIRIMGPASTSGDIFSSDHTYRINPAASGQYVERFRVRQGEMPNSSWRTYGDFTWGTAASGSWTSSSDLATAPLHDNYSGNVASGLFHYLGDSHGNGDGFSMQSSPANLRPTGATGVLECSLHLTSSRTIGFDLRIDPYSGDRVDFYTRGQFDAATGVLRFTSAINPRDWVTETFDLPTDAYTLKWVYTRGPAATGSFPISIASAWLDNVSGLNGMSMNQYKGFLRGTLPFDTGAIYGWLNAKFDGAVHGYTKGLAPSESIHGYLPSAVSPDVVTSVYGYLKGMGMSINGYLLGSSGIDITTYPTGAIHGFVAGAQSGSSSTIHGFVRANYDQIINGYLYGSTEINESGAIHGYVSANNALSSIYGLVNGSGENYSVSPIHGYVDARFGQGDQVIHGYVMVASGGIDSIQGYTRCWDETSSFFMDPQTMIWGYLMGPPTGIAIHGYVRAIMPFTSIYGYLGSEGLVASGGGLVGQPSTSNVVAGTNFLHGYLKGYTGDQFIHGYLMGPVGVTTYIHGYVLSGADDNQINGFTIGAQLASTGIYGYASGSLGGDSSIYGYTKAASGIEQSSIYGYLVANTILPSNINGTLIGTVARAGSSGACPSHTFPLQALPSYTIPTVFLNP